MKDVLFSRKTIGFIYLVGFLFYINVAFGQEINGVGALKLGDTVPNLPLTIRVGDSVLHKHLADFRGSVVILDFWSTHCSTCIYGIPLLWKLQREFGKKIEIIMVTSDTQEKINELWANLCGHFNFYDSLIFSSRHLFMITQDTALNRLFEHRAIPVHAWIDRDGIFRDISYVNTTTEGNIDSFLKGNITRLASVSVKQHDFNPFSIFKMGNYSSCDDGEDYSCFMGHLEYGMGEGGSSDVDSYGNRGIALYEINKSILELYKIAYKNNLKVEMDDVSRVVVSIKDPHRIYNYLSWDDPRLFEWLDSNTFCYSIKSKKEETDSVYDFMREDLDRHFHLKSYFDEKTISCMVLKRIGPLTMIKASGEKTNRSWSVKRDGKIFVLRNQSWDFFSGQIQEVVNAKDAFLPFFDEVKFEGNVDMDLPWNDRVEDVPIDKLRKALNIMGLDLVRESRTLKVLCIVDDGLSAKGLRR